MATPNIQGNPLEERNPRWFVSASAGMNLTRLFGALRARGVNPYVLSDVAPLGSSIIDSLMQAVDAAELVLIILSSEEASENVLFEAGMAVGRGKEVIVIIDPSERLPANLSGMLTIRARPDDLPAINFVLDQASGRPSSSTRPTVETSHPLGARADQLVAELLTINDLTESQAIEILATALEDSGVIAAPAPTGNFGLDLGVWSDDLEAIAANPLFIELKLKLTARAVSQLSKRLTNSSTYNVRMALLVYIESADPINHLQGSANVPIIAISLRELLERLSIESFPEIIRSLRNRTAHGGS